MVNHPTNNGEPHPNNGEPNKTVSIDTTVDTINTEPSSDGVKINFLISLFKEVDSNYKRLFNRPNQKDALKRMVKEHGLEKLENMIKYLPQSNSIQYCPKAYTPIQLEEKMAAIRDHLSNKKNAWTVI